jgi:hypothetical protein
MRAKNSLERLKNGAFSGILKTRTNAVGFGDFPFEGARGR